VTDSHQPAMTELVMGAVAQTWVFGVSVPVVIDDRVRYILSMSIDPEHIRRVIAETPRDPEWIIAVSDRTGRLIARSQDHAEYVGREIHPDVRAWSSGTEGVHRTPSLAGHEVLRGCKWAGKPGWLVAAFVPSAVVDAPLRRLWRWFAMLAAAIAAVSLPLAYFIARQISDPISAAWLRLDTDRAGNSGSPGRAAI
jgi:hypothetical protein